MTTWCCLRGPARNGRQSHRPNPSDRTLLSLRIDGDSRTQRRRQRSARREEPESRPIQTNEELPCRVFALSSESHRNGSRLRRRACKAQCWNGLQPPDPIVPAETCQLCFAMKRTGTLLQMCHSQFHSRENNRGRGSIVLNQIGSDRIKSSMIG